MKLRTKIFGTLSAVSGLVLIATLFLPLFRSVESDGSGVTYKLFDEFIDMDTRFMALNETFQPALANMINVLVIMAVILAGLFVLFFVLQWFQVSFMPVRAILKALSITLILVGGLAIVCALTFVAMNKVWIQERLVLSFQISTGAIFLMIFSLISGVAGFIGEFGYDE